MHAAAGFSSFLLFFRVLPQLRGESALSTRSATDGEKLVRGRKITTKADLTVESLFSRLGIFRRNRELSNKNNRYKKSEG